MIIIVIIISPIITHFLLCCEFFVVFLTGAADASGDPGIVLHLRQVVIWVCPAVNSRLVVIISARQQAFLAEPLLPLVTFDLRPSIVAPEHVEMLPLSGSLVQIQKVLLLLLLVHELFLLLLDLQHQVLAQIEKMELLLLGCLDLFRHGFLLLGHHGLHHGQSAFLGGYRSERTQLLKSQLGCFLSEFDTVV